MTSPSRKRNARGSGALLREEILVAATALLDAADNEAEVTLRRIACAAGISAPAIYAHFEDRNAVMVGIVERSWRQVVSEIRAGAAEETTPRDRLLRGCATYVAYAQQYPMRYAVMTQATRMTPAAREALDVLTRALASCQTRSGTRPQTGRVAAALSTALHGAAMLNRTDAPSMWLCDVSSDEVISTLVDSAIDQQNRPTEKEPG
ncbi:TetR/AcrR family transcriptional regulator [Mycolicibacterium sp. XJ870]